MPSTINATTSGVVTTGDSVATLSLQTGGTTAVAIDTAQIVTLSKSLALLGSTSGSVTIAAPAVAGSTTITLPATSGTLLQSGTAVTVAQGGTGITSGTSGGVPYFSGGTTVASSAALTANGVVYGGGTGNAPVATAAGTTGQFLGANTGGAPTWQTPSGGGSPGGSNTQIQFNNSSAFGGSSNLVWDGTSVGVGTSTPATYSDTTPGITTYNSTAGGRSGIVMGSNATATNDLMGYVACFNSNSSNTNYRMGQMRFLRGTDANSAYFAWHTANSGNPAERMRLTQDGNLGLGATPSPWDSTCTAIQIGGTAAVASTGTGTQLDIANNVYLASGSYNYRTSAAATFYRQGSNGTHGFYVAAAGTAGAAMSFGPVALQVNNDKSVNISNGTLNCAGISSGTVYGTTVTSSVRNLFIDNSGAFGGISSTRESKTNIAPLSSASWVQQLNPVTFNYRKKDETGAFTDEFESETQFGLIADEVEAVAPDFCIYVNDKLQGIHYDRMIAPLIKAIQELTATNEALTARIAALEAK
jgi:hypothetical protein